MFFFLKEKVGREEGRGVKTGALTWGRGVEEQLGGVKRKGGKAGGRRSIYARHVY